MNQTGVVMSRVARFMLLAVMAALIAGSAAAAEPNPNSNAGIAAMVKMGVKPFFLGNRSGLDAWLMIKNGQVQIVYAPVGGSDVVIGAMFDGEGQNVTAKQIEKAVKENPNLLTSLKDDVVGKQLSQLQAAQTAQTATPVAKADSPGERLIKEMASAVGVVVGSTTAPQVTMVMDPNCRHCRATWGQLRDLVFKNTLQIRLVPIGSPDSDSERAAAMLIRSADAVNVWDKYAAGDKGQLKGTPAPDAVAAVRANHVLIDRWHIDATPYFVYRAKNGQVKIISGEIEKIDTLVTDVVP